MNTMDMTLEHATYTLKPFALRLTKDIEAANDLLQETALKAFVNKDKFKEGTNLKAWLYTIMRNTFITNYQRIVKRNTFIDTTENLHYINTVVTHNEGQSAFVMEDIQLALAQLESIYREPFMMYYNGFKYHEIAEKLDIPLGTVKNRIHIARKMLKEQLSVYSYHE